CVSGFGRELSVGKSRANPPYPLSKGGKSDKLFPTPDSRLPIPDSRFPAFKSSRLKPLLQRVPPPPRVYDVAMPPLSRLLTPKARALERDTFALVLDDGRRVEI